MGGGKKTTSLGQVFATISASYEAAKRGALSGGIEVKVNWHDGRLTTCEVTKRDHSALSS